MKYILLSSIFFFAALAPAVSQEKHCGTTEASKELYRDHPELIQKQTEYNTALHQKIVAKRALKNSTSDQVYIIPVVFHVIHTNGTENISDEQIQDQINILNRDYRKLNVDLSNVAKNTEFDSIASDIRIEFRLAQLDPKGNCTNGIDRIYSQLTNNGGDQSKLNQWPREKYLNIWTVKSIGASGVAGYAYFPSDVETYLSPYDGILILSNYIGSIGTSTPYTSRALTHEIGHYLSLYHPWGGTNSPEVDCSGDDQVDDTPTTRGHLTCDLYTPYCTLYPLQNTPYDFSNVTTTSGTIDPTPLPTNTGVIFGAPAAVGISANSSANTLFSFSDWGTGGDTINHDSTYSALTGTINTGKYYEVTLTPAFKNSLTLSKMTFSFKRDSAGVRTYAVRSSLDGFATNLPASISPANKVLKVEANNVFFSYYDTDTVQKGSTITFNSSFKNLLTPVTIRIYGWNAEDSTGTFGIDNLTFIGNAGVIENTQNYMDYSYCSIMFTKGQKERMRAALESTVSGRNNLWTTNNLIATGTNGNGQICVPVCDFYSIGTSIICEGQNLSYKSNVQKNMPGTPLSYQWEFKGGNPATSTLENPTVNYPTPGNYDTKLTVSNSAGSSTIEKTWFVYVHEKDEYLIRDGFSEGFEDLDRYKYKWRTRNLDQNQYGWERADVGFNSDHSVRMNAYGNFAMDIDQLFSPTMAMYFMLNTKLSFRCAAATKATLVADMNDALNVYYSINCGSTWLLLLNLKGAALISSGYHSEYFIPNSAAQWALHEANIPVTNTNNKVILKFEYKTGSKSNNIYIDDINLSGVVGINENALVENNINLFPNPTSESAVVSYHLTKKSVVNMELSDVLGKQLLKIDQGAQPEGDYSLNISKNELNLKTGIYFIKLTIGNAAITRKLVITE